MSRNKKITGNLFSSTLITPERFLNFCMYVQSAMRSANTAGKYDTFITQLQTVIDAIRNEMKDISTGTSGQVLTTNRINDLIYSFGRFMKDNNGAIAYALGGITVPAYYQFYPYKIVEYITATKKTMPILAARVAALATTYIDSLGTKLAGDLQSFLPTYNELVDLQRRQITDVKQNRIQRTDVFTSAQWTLTGIVHDVASLNNGNPDETNKLFPFAVLYPARKDNRLTFTGTLKIKEQKELQNRTLTEKVTVAIRNTSLNADILVWLAASPTATVPDTAILVKADSEMKVYAEKLGDLAGTFLMIKNASIINTASYIVKMGGQRKKEVVPPTPAVEEAKAMLMARA